MAALNCGRRAPNSGNAPSIELISDRLIQANTKETASAPVKAVARRFALWVRAELATASGPDERAAIWRRAQRDFKFDLERRANTPPPTPKHTALPSPSFDDELVGEHDIARFLNCPYQTVWERMQQKTLPVYSNAAGRTCGRKR